MTISLHEADDRFDKLKSQFESLHGHFSRYRNISYPVGYALQLLERHAQLPTIYVLTPTNNKRPVQLADLTRMRNTLWLVPKLVWIVIEDSASRTDKIARFLERSGMPYVHLNAATPDEHELKPGEKPWIKSRGVLQRNEGIAWLREHHAELSEQGVVYFADDDNTYDIRLFEEVGRRTVRTLPLNWPALKLSKTSPRCASPRRCPSGQWPLSAK